MDGETVRHEPIAVVGLACRLPQAAGPEAFWRLLRDGVDAVMPAPPERWSPEILPEFRSGGFLDQVDRFDAEFFGIAPAEADAMDPQQRLVLELAWEAMENARLRPDDLRAAGTGVFVGAIAHDYAALQDQLPEPSAYGYPGSSRAIIANRVSYLLGLTGPSLTLDSGQSSSLVAVQLACESLRRGESRLALAGGVNLNLRAETTAAIGRFGALSPRGRCSVFDARADGYVRGEGGGLVVLKPLSAAQRDGDVVLGVVLGGAVNNDGGGDGLTVPNAPAQRALVESACRRAGVAPHDVRYVELHGTGTRVGDPVEAAALGAALGAGRPAGDPLLVGSVKTNIGHLEGAAGIAGLLKVLLSIRKAELPPSLHFGTANPDIPLTDLGLRVVTERTGWPQPERPRVAGVSSFGMGGTNCHLLVGPAPTEPPAPVRRPDLPWVLSARSADALRAQAGALLDHLTEHPDLEPGLALAVGRTHFEHRAVLVAEDHAQRLAGLEAFAAGHAPGAVVTGRATGGPCVFAFPGQGSQWPEMARGLLAASPGFARRIDECAAALAPFVDFSLTDVLRGVPGAPGFDRVDVVQPALWAVMVALADRWAAHGVTPGLVIGHSQGEIAAAVAVGALSLEDGARVVALRSRALARIAGRGGMLSVAAAPDVVRPHLGAGVTLAAVNGPRSVVLSGARDDLDELRQTLLSAGHRARFVAVDYASHSAAVEGVRAELLDALAGIRPRSCGTPFVSTCTGEPIDTAELGPEYWYRSLREPVRFDTATRRALDAGAGLFVECSPHPVLGPAIEESIEEAAGSLGHPAVVIGTLRRGSGGPDRFRRSLAEAFAAGVGVDWVGADWAGVDRAGSAPVRRDELVDLPTYAFQRRRHWLPGAGAAASADPAGTVPARGPRPGRRQLRDMILTVTADVVGSDRVAPGSGGRAFSDLGVDSVAAVEIRGRLRSATGLGLPTGLLFDHPTPDELAAHLDAVLSAEAGGEPDAVPAAGVATVDRPVPPEGDPIAIVAMGCRYPGDVTSPDGLWELVSTGGEAISEFPRNRGWDLAALFSAGADRSGTSDTRHGGFLHDADQFDAAFFGISPREATAMDPQQRLLLEICWETLERGGIDPDALRGSRTGVFVGAMAPDYGPRMHRSGPEVEGHLLTGTALSVVSGRIAYTLGLTGPALTVDTACSSSLVAVHLAAQALRRGECSLALAGGATVMSTAGMFVEFSRQGGLAADGRCKAFGAGADGTGWSEGAGMLLLERLSDARRHGHPVLAVLRGSAVNQDGRSNGMTAPNGPAQERVIHEALADAGLSTADVDAVEAHGTGTRLGDPIEAQSLMATYGRDRAADRPLWLGSAKSNLGHTQAAAGVAGVIKMVKALEHRVLPRTLHVDEPTPHVDWSSGGVHLLTEAVPLPADRTARAAVSSFGISGTNAHVVLEQAPPGEGADDVPAPAAPLVWVISARTREALRAQARRLLDFAVTAPGSDLSTAGSLLAVRTPLEHRAVVVATDREDLLSGLAALAEGRPHRAAVEGVAAPDVRPVFLFPGQGTQWAGMAAELLETDAVFRDRLRECDEALARHTGWSVADVLTGRPGAPALEGSDIIQPVLFAVMVALSAVWRSWGLEPAAVVGHSQGEITAACVAGALSVEDAATVVALRSRILMKLTGTGGMLAVPLPAAQVEEQLRPWAGRLWSAIRSGPASTVVAGDLDALEEFAAACGDTVTTRRVAIDYAAHTPHIEAVRDEMLAALAAITPRATDVEFCSSLEGAMVTTDTLDAGYWYRGLSRPVLFDQAVRTLAASGTPLFVEAAPHPVLGGHVRDTLREAGLPGAAVGSLRRNEGGLHRMLLSAAQAYVLGAGIDWRGLLGPARRTVELPTYPFEHRRYWIDADGGSKGDAHPLLDPAVALAEGGGHLLRGRLSGTDAPWLADHRVEGAVLLPGTAFVELALTAAAAVGARRVDDLTLEAPLVLPAAAAVELQIRVTDADERGRRSLTLYGRTEDGADGADGADAEEAGSWVRYATARLLDDPGPEPEPPAAWPPAEEAVDLDQLYPQLADRGYDYGPAFQGLVGAWRGPGVRYAEVALPEPVRADAGRHGVHPALLDAVLHLLVLDGVDDDSMLLPFSWSGVSVFTRGADRLRVRIADTGPDRVSLAAVDGAGRPAVVVEDLVLRRVPRHRATPARPTYSVTWRDFSPAELDLTGVRLGVVGGDAAAQELQAALAGCGARVEPAHDLVSLADLSAGDVPDVVLAPFAPEVDPDDVPYSVREGLYPALDLVQGWLADERFAGRRLVFLTRGVVDGTVDGLAAAPLWGLLRSAQSEHPGRFVLADVEAPVWSRLIATVAAGQTQMTVRGGSVAVPRLVPDEQPESGTAPAGTVLVTGATGALGALVARRLVEVHGVRRLLLLSRRGPGAPGAGELVAGLEELGATCDVVACDVSNRRSLARALARIPADAPLTGVVHAAGLLDDAVIESLSPDRFEDVLAPKVDGAWHLHELTADLPLTAFVLFSSVAGVIGTAGQGNYAAANAFLDALAAHRLGAGRPARSVDWGLWGAEGGMIGSLGDAEVARMGRAGIAPLGAEAALQLFDRVLRTHGAQVVAAGWDRPGLRAAADGGVLPDVLAELVPARRRPTAPLSPASSAPSSAPVAPAAVATGGTTSFTERLAALPGADGRALLSRMVRSHVAAVLGHAGPDAVEVDRAFTELGFDSLTAVDLRNRIDAETGLRLPSTMAFDYPTVSALSAHLHDELAPPAAALEDTLRQTLEHVHGALPAGDEATRTKLVALLRSTLDRLGPGTAPVAATGADVLDPTGSASDEEIFAFIDQQL